MSAARARPRTVGSMTPDPTTRYGELVAAIVHSGTRGAPLMLAALSTLTRPHEMFHLDTAVFDGKLHVPTIDVDGFRVPGRHVPLSATAASLLLVPDGPLTAALAVPGHLRARVVTSLREELAELEVARPPALEQLWLCGAEAVLHRAPSAAHRQALLAYIGLPATTARAHAVRQAALPALYGWVAAEIDALAALAGLRLDAHAAARHA